MNQVVWVLVCIGYMLGLWSQLEKGLLWPQVSGGSLQMTCQAQSDCHTWIIQFYADSIYHRTTSVRRMWGVANHPILRLGVYITSSLNFSVFLKLQWLEHCFYFFLLFSLSVSSPVHVSLCPLKDLYLAMERCLRICLPLSGPNVFYLISLSVWNLTQLFEAPSHIKVGRAWWTTAVILYLVLVCPDIMCFSLLCQEKKESRVEIKACFVLLLWSY